MVCSCSGASDGVRPGTKLRIPAEIISTKDTLGFGTETVHWDSFTELLCLTEKKKIPLIHQVVSSDIFEIQKKIVNAK